MKKAILVTLAILAALTPLPAAHGEEPLTYTVLLAGGPESNEIRIWLTPDGRTYVIDSIYQLEVGGNVCEHPAGNTNELVCQAPQVGVLRIQRRRRRRRGQGHEPVHIPVTMRGGPGADKLVGGAGADKLLGGEGPDRLIGRDGDECCSAGKATTRSTAAPATTSCAAAPAIDELNGGTGENHLEQSSCGVRRSCRACRVGAASSIRARTMR